MPHGENDGNASEEMEQDAGKTWHGDHRKVRSPCPRTNSEGEFCSDVGDKVPMPFSLPSDVTRADVAQILRENNASGSVAMGSEGPSNSYSGPMTGSLVDHQSRLVAETRKVIQPVINANVEIREAVSMNAVRPNNLREMKAYELQAVCRDWNIQTSGTKGELLDRLERLFSQEMAKKSCSMKFIKLVEEDDPSAVQGPAPTVPQATNFPSPDRGPQSYPQQADPAYRRRAAVKIVDQLLPPSKEITSKDLVAIYLLCYVGSVVHRWWQDRIGVQGSGSSVAASSQLLGVMSPMHCSRAWRSSMAAWKHLASPLAASLEEKEEACSFMVQAEAHDMKNSVNVGTPQGEISYNEQLHDGDFSGKNSEQPSMNLDSVSLPTESALKSHHQLEARRGQLNEAKVALVDTMSVMHA